jgi:hypothetical protein
LIERDSQYVWLVGTFAELKGALLADGPSFHLAVGANQTLHNWLGEQIRSTDTRFGEYLQGRSQGIFNRVRLLPPSSANMLWTSGHLCRGGLQLGRSGKGHYPL